MGNNMVNEREIKTDCMKAAVESLNNEGYRSSFRERYSGRFMYGAETSAIVSDADAGTVNVAFYKALVDYIESNGITEFTANDKFDDWSLTTRDDMGKGNIYYRR